jgi:microcystin-dependent protein
MAEPYLGEIRIMSFNFPPKGWVLCNGQLLPINQNQALFSLLGTTYGGDGRTTFGLPNLQARVPMHPGNGHVAGELAGENAHTLTIAEMAQHVHFVKAAAVSADAGNPGHIPSPTKVLAQAHAATGTGTADVNLYGTAAANEIMAPQTVNNTGGSQPHENRQPYLVLNFCIALQGIFPSRN